MSGEPKPTLTEADCRLLNLKGLAARLGVSYDFVKDMRSNGFELPFGGLTTLTHALRWINAHGNFREDARLLRLSNRRGRASRRPRTNAGKCDALPSRRDAQSSSPHSQECPRELAA